MSLNLIRSNPKRFIKHFEHVKGIIFFKFLINCRVQRIQREKSKTTDKTALNNGAITIFGNRY